MSLPKDFEISFKSAHPLNTLSLLTQDPPRMVDDLRHLPSFIREITRAKSVTEIEDGVDYLGQTLLGATFLDPGSQPIREISGHLSVTLDTPEAELSSPYSKPVAVVISDALTYQMSLPLMRRYSATNLVADNSKSFARNYIEDMQEHLRIKFDQDDDGSSFKAMSQSMVKYKSSVTNSANRTDVVDMNRDELISFLNAINPFMEIVESGLYQDLDCYTSPSLKKWQEDISNVIVLEATKNPELHTLIGDGNLDHLALKYRTLLWSLLNVASDTNTGIEDNPVLKSASDYFFRHPEAANIHWSYTTRPDFKLSVNSEALTDDVGPECLFGNGRLTQWMFLQDPETFQSFLETLDLDEQVKSRKRRISALSKLWTIVARLTAMYPHQQNSELFIAKLDQESSLHAPGIFNTLSSVLRRAASGIIYANSKGEAKVIAPDQKQSIEGLSREFQGRGAQIVFKVGYESDMSETANGGEKSGFAEKRDIITPVSEYTLSPFKSLSETDPDSAKAVLKTLNERVDYPRAYFNELDEMSTKPKVTLPATHVLFPGLLPKDHPIATLETAGIVAVAQKGTSVDVIVSPDKAKIDTQPQNGNLALHGEIINSRMLVMEGAINSFSHFRIHQMVEAALSFLARPNLSQELGRDEVTEVRRLIKDWKSYAKASGLPHDLSRVEDPLHRDPNSIYTLVQIGQKHDVLKVSGTTGSAGFNSIKLPTN